jgi:hypothetical protein
LGSRWAALFFARVTEASCWSREMSVIALTCRLHALVMASREHDGS